MVTVNIYRSLYVVLGIPADIQTRHTRQTYRHAYCTKHGALILQQLNIWLNRVSVKSPVKANVYAILIFLYTKMLYFLDLYNH